MTQEEYQEFMLGVCSAQEDVDVKQEYINSLEQKLSNIKHNYEAQEIMITDYKKRIAELEAPKSCEGCELYEMPKEWSPCNVCIRNCADYYEPKDK